MDQNSFLSAFPSKSIPPLGGQTAVNVPGRLPEYTYAHTHTHTHALMPVDVCDGLCCFLINSSHADWSIHLITGCIDSGIPLRGEETDKTGQRHTIRDTKGQSKGTNKTCTEEQSRPVGERPAQTSRSTDK